VWLAVLCVFQQNFIHVSAGILEQTISAVEDDEGDLTVTEHTQLISLLHQTKLTFGEGHLKAKKKLKK